MASRPSGSVPMRVAIAPLLPRRAAMTAKLETAPPSCGPAGSMSHSNSPRPTMVLRSLIETSAEGGDRAAVCAAGMGESEFATKALLQAADASCLQGRNTIVDHGPPGRAPSLSCAARRIYERPQWRSMQRQHGASSCGSFEAGRFQRNGLCEEAQCTEECWQHCWA